MIGLVVGAIQAGRDQGHTGEDRDAGFGGRTFLGGFGLLDFGAHQHPLRDDGLVDQVLLGRVLRPV
jgi:hypothetical protein